jgi:hypothetical protein
MDDNATFSVYKSIVGWIMLVLFNLPCVTWTIIHNLLDKKIMQGNLLKDYQFQKKFGHFVFTLPHALMFH